MNTETRDRGINPEEFDPYEQSLWNFLEKTVPTIYRKGQGIIDLRVTLGRLYPTYLKVIFEQIQYLDYWKKDQIPEAAQAITNKALQAGLPQKTIEVAKTRASYLRRRWQKEHEKLSINSLN